MGEAGFGRRGLLRRSTYTWNVTSAQRTHNIVLPVVQLQIDEHKEAYSWHNTELIKA